MYSDCSTQSIPSQSATGGRNNGEQQGRDVIARHRRQTQPSALSECRVIRPETQEARCDVATTGQAALLRTGPIVPSAVSYSAIVIATSMRLPAICRRIIATDTGVLVLSALALVALHTATNGEYGFHRDELATIDDNAGTAPCGRGSVSAAGWQPAAGC